MPTKATHYIPARAHGVTPYLIVHDGRKALAWYEEVFGAGRESVMDGPEDKVMHSEIRIGDAQVYVADEFPDVGFVSPKTLGGTPCSVHLYVPDVDATHRRAIAAGATEIRPPEDQFWGDRFSQFTDPFGHRWGVATHIEDLTEEEMGERVAKAAAEFEQSHE